MTKIWRRKFLYVTEKCYLCNSDCLVLSATDTAADRAGCRQRKPGRYYGINKRTL